MLHTRWVWVCVGVWVWVCVWVWVWVCAYGCAWVVVGPTVIEHAYTYVHIHKY